MKYFSKDSPRTRFADARIRSPSNPFQQGFKAVAGQPHIRPKDMKFLDFLLESGNPVSVINAQQEVQMSFIKLSRGEQYPLPVRAYEGAAANFLTNSGNVLQIAMPNLVRTEARSIRNDPMKAGIIVEGPLILWVFQFGTIILDCPFDARIIPASARWLPDIENDQQRLSIEVHLVDTASNILRGIRFVTLSPSLTHRFLMAVQDQLCDQRDLTPYLSRSNAIPVTRLPTLAQVERCGT
ncbi:hypothetical protein NOF55_16445 [Rhizobiaceae bacterium BDR2-2]|uniref:Uncharacterized protein n=1 Tax=Ectorhizobium quercum TaxID=2965071 RepID=A0AAE3MZX3_9HYPH|nr:hypothetical protein [Ectorhizobium quercum]MCX8996257.1 hypothetical protein [Ectorhizobium quercum]MCX8998704.1 hypothetical protein [Ectorhizobium quercum]